MPALIVAGADHYTRFESSVARAKPLA